MSIKQTNEKNMSRKSDKNVVVSAEVAASNETIESVPSMEQIKASLLAEIEAEKAQKQNEQAKNHRERLAQAVVCFSRKCLSAGKTLGEYANAISSSNIPHMIDIASMNGASYIKLACLFESASKFITDLVEDGNGIETQNEFAKTRKVKIIDKSPRAKAYQILIKLQKLVQDNEKSKNEITSWNFQ